MHEPPSCSLQGMKQAESVPEDLGQDRVLILDTAGVDRVVKTARAVGERFLDLHPVVVSSLGRANRFHGRGLDSFEAGDRSLDLQTVDFQCFLEESRATTVVIPLGWPREALKYVARFIGANPKLRFLVDLGLGPMGIRPSVLRGLLWLTTWLLWAPQFACIRVLNFIDGFVTVGIQWLALMAGSQKEGQPSGSVCHVITSLGTGGAQRQLINYLQNTSVKLSEITVLVLWRDRSLVDEELDTLDLPVVNLSSGEESDESRGMVARGLRLTLAFWRLFIWFRRERPECVYSWLFYANILTPPAASLAGIPRIIATVRNLSVWKTWGEFRSWWFRLAEQGSSRLCEVIVANSEAVRNDYIAWSGIDAERITVVPNGVDIQGLMARPWEDVRAIHGIPPNEKIVLNVARLTREKGQEFLIRSFAEVLGRGYAATLVIVGHGSFESTLRQLAEDLNLTERVVFAGRQADTQSYYREADVFCLSSVIEGMPNVVLEALAFGLPVVATRAGGTAEVIVDGETGLLVDSGDLEGLTSALSRVIGDSGLGRRLGDSGARTVAEKYNTKTMAQRIDSIIQQDRSISGVS